MVARGLALKAGRVLAQSAVAVPLTGSTSETTLATITIPAGAMGANGRVVVEADWSFTGSANTKTMRVRLGATAVYAAALTTPTAVAATARIANRNSAASQRVTTQHGTSTNAFAYTSTTATIDTSASADITITGQLGLGTETITLESYQVILYPKG